MLILASFLAAKSRFLFASTDYQADFPLAVLLLRMMHGLRD